MDVKYEEKKRVTHIIGNVIFPPFLEEAEATRIAESENKKEIYEGKTKEEIIDMWRENRDLGTLLHSYIESYLGEKEVHVTDKSKVRGLPTYSVRKEYNQFLEFWKELRESIPDIEIHMLEQKLHDKISGINGTPDCVMVGKGKYYLFDWKRSPFEEPEEEKYGITDEYLGFLVKHKLTKHHLQLNFYSEMLRRQKGIDVECRMYVVYFWGPSGTYKMSRAKVYPGIKNFMDNYN